MAQNKNEITIILGPTSSGKTSLALSLCKEEEGIIISADSRQVYKKLDIGTGKMPANYSGKIQVNDCVWQVDGVEIWGYDLVEMGEYFSVVDFVEFASKVIEKEKARPRPRRIFVVGGTGFYIDVLSGRISLNSKGPDLNLRSELEKKDLTSLLSLLASLNPTLYKSIDQKNQVRVLRAVENELSQKQSVATSLLVPKLNFRYFGLTADRAVLYKRVDTWLDFVWRNGLLDEVRNLQNDFAHTPQMHGLIYKTVMAYLKGDFTEEVATQRCKFDLHAFVRRQQTWFKRNPEITWLDISANPLDQLRTML